jgi:hypothetical protein
MYNPTGTSDSSGFSERDSGFSNGCSNTAGNQPPPFRSAFPGFQRSESPNIADRMRTGSPGINFEPVFQKFCSNLPDNGNMEYLSTLA